MQLRTHSSYFLAYRNTYSTKADSLCASPFGHTQRMENDYLGNSSNHTKRLPRDPYYGPLLDYWQVCSVRSHHQEAGRPLDENDRLLTFRVSPVVNRRLIGESHRCDLDFS